MTISNWKTSLVSIVNVLTIKLVRFGYFNNSNSNLVRLGTDYGGWYIPENILENTKSRVLLSLGAGFDVSFDLKLCEAGFTVIVVDPLSDCIEHARSELSSFKSCFYENVAVSNFRGTETFFAPKNPDHDSWSSTNLQRTSEVLSKQFPVRTLGDLFTAYDKQMSGAFVYLKMDIEGAEIKVIPQIIKLTKPVDFLGIEMDFLSLIPFSQMHKRVKSIFQAREYLRNLKISGLNLVLTDNYNFFWERANER